MDAAALFENAMKRLRHDYAERPFFLERDIVWTVQVLLWDQVTENGLPYRVLNDYALCNKRADLVILNGDRIEVAAEFKYEPSHHRSSEFGPGKFPVVAWTEVLTDVERIRRFVDEGNVRTAYAVLIDEGGHFRPHQVSPPSRWRNWDNGVCVLWTKVTRP